MPEAVDKVTGETSMNGEVYPTMTFADVSVAEVGEKCRVVHVTGVWNVTSWAQKPQHYWWRRWYDVTARSVSDEIVKGIPNSSIAAEHAQRRVSSVIC